jgi:hypothetical protein
MPNAAEFLRGQIDASAEAWKAAYIEASECAEVDKAVADGLTLFRIGRLADERFTSAVEGGGKFDEKRAAELIEFYRWWLDPCDFMLRKIAEFEDKTYKVDGADEFRRAVNLARGIVTMSAASIAKAIAQAGRGESVQLEEALHALQGEGNT